MNNKLQFRLYGQGPYNIAVIHGGPGAPGEMQPVAKKLESRFSVLEPLQTANTLEGQVTELFDIINKQADKPIILIGFSYGAMLSFIFTARYPKYVKKLILVSSGAFEEKYAKNILQTRLSRLSEDEKILLETLTNKLNKPNTKDKNKIFTQLGKIIFKSDSFDPLSEQDLQLEAQFDIFKSVWQDCEQFRSVNGFTKLGQKIKCPVVAIHGDYDPHPIEGIKEPLSKVLDDFKFIILENCGHYPWKEKAAYKKFYQILEEELI